MALLPACAPALFLACAFLLGCTTGKTGNTNNSNMVCNNDGICDPGENVLNCMDCIGISCTMESMSGEFHHFLVAELFIPDSPLSALECGLDLDGDGEVDNRLGSILSFLGDLIGDLDLNAQANQDILEGRLLLVPRVLIDQWGRDEMLIFQMLTARVLGDATPLFQGNDTVAFDPDTPQDFYFCGRLWDDILEAGPDNAYITISLPGVGPVDVTIAKASFKGRTLETGWEDVVIGAGIAQRELETRLYPAFVQWMNSEITEDSTGPRATRLLHWLDDRCEPSVEGCDPLPEGCAPDGEIHLDELLCNDVLSATMASDVDLSGDGQKDHISIGLKIVRAVPVSLVAP